MVASSTSASWTLAEFIQKLEDAGNTLLQQYASVDELLDRLENLHHLLRRLDQTPSSTMEQALKPSMAALVSDELFRNDDLSVKVSVLCCICEISRITAPDQPYGDKEMREVFELLIMIFRKLSCMTANTYAKATLILENFAKCQLYMLMWDSDDALIVEMFRIFLHTTQENHPASVISIMENIMISIIKDEVDVPDELFKILLCSVRKENEDVSPLSYSMAKRVFNDCAIELKRRLPAAVRLADIALDNYADIVSRVCKDAEEIAADNGGTREVGLSACVPSESVVNSDAASTRKDLTLKNGISAEKLQCLEYKQQEVLVTETNSQGQDSDAIRADLKEAKTKAVSALERTEDTSKDEKSLATFQCSDQIKMQEDSDLRTAAGPITLDASTLVQLHLNSEAVPVPTKRGRKPNSLIKPEEGYDNSWIHGEKKSPDVPRCRRNCAKEMDDSRNLVSKSSSLLSGLVMDIHPLRAHGTRNRSFPSKKRTRKRDNRIKDNLSNGEGGLGLSSVSGRDLTRTSSEEKASEAGAITKCDLPGQEEPEMEHTKCPTHNIFTKISDGCSRNPKSREGSSVRMVSNRRRHKATSEHVRRKCRLKTLTSLETPKASAQKFNETSKANRKRKHTPVKEKAVQDNGERLVGCRIQVYWPLDKKFYRGSITSFDNETKNHKVTYDDGDEEVLDLAKEHWELIEHDISSDFVGRASGMLAAAKHGLSNNHAASSSQPAKKKQKVSIAKSSERVSTYKRRRQKTLRSKSKLNRGKEIALVTPASLKMESPCPEVETGSSQDEEGVKPMIEPSEALPLVSVQVSTGSCATVDTHACLLKASSKPILEAITAKYGDIAANCRYNSPIVKGTLLQVVCDVVQKLKSSVFTLSDIKVMISEVSDAMIANLDVSWLQQYLLTILEEAETARRSSDVLKKMYLVKKAAMRDIEQKRAEVAAAEAELRKAEKCSEVFKLVMKKIDNDFLAAAALEKSRQERLDKLL